MLPRIPAHAAVNLDMSDTQIVDESPAEREPENFVARVTAKAGNPPGDAR